uniref:Beta-1,4-galactosyltransferase 6 n=1 Tax=Propithecus coquereli TaxID=379532 RepID=A0A2K6EN73_PROCO
MSVLRRVMRISNRSLLAFIFFFSLSSSCLYFIYVAPGIDYPEGNNSSDYLVQTTTYLPENFTYSPNLPCPEKLPYMRGFLDVNVSEVSFDEIHQLFSKDLDIEPGGHWRPKDCKPRWKVAVLIPFRNRHEHLPIFFLHLIPMLQKQRLEFAFYVIEQVSKSYSCFSFFSLRLPSEMISNIEIRAFLCTSKMNPHNPFICEIFISLYFHFHILYCRVHYAGYNVTRPEGDLGKYKSIPHHHRGEVQFLGRYKLLRYSKERQYIDGLNNLIYRPKILVDRLYTNISVNLMPELAPIEDY